MRLPTFSFEAIGTQWAIYIGDEDGEVSSDLSLELSEKIQKRIAVFDLHYSRFRSDSLVSEMSRVAGVYTLPADAEALFDVYKKTYDVTGGLVTPLIGQALVDLGYDAQYSLVPKTVIGKVPQWKDVLHYDYPLLTVKTPVLLDFGAAGKGYLIDIIGKILKDSLRNSKVFSFTVDAGGDILHAKCEKHITSPRQRLGVMKIEKKLRVGLENPEDTTQIIGVAEVCNESICGSAGNRRTWQKLGNKGEIKKLTHIIHPETHSSPKGISAIWTIASTACVADMLATALSFVSPEILRPHFLFEYLILNTDYSINKSEGFVVELFTV